MTTDNPQWFTSSYSGNGGQCVEVATNLAASHGTIPVRDSKDPHGPALNLTPTAWTAFIQAVKRGELHA